MRAGARRRREPGPERLRRVHPGLARPGRVRRVSGPESAASIADALDSRSGSPGPVADPTRPALLQIGQFFAAAAAAPPIWRRITTRADAVKPAALRIVYVNASAPQNEGRGV